MVGKSIALLGHERKSSRRLVATLRAAGNEVLSVDTPDVARELIAARAVDLVVVDCRGDVDAGAVIASAGGEVPVLAMDRADDPATLVDLVCEHGVDHLLAHSGTGAIDERQVVTTAEKILRRDLFGLEKYLPTFGVEIASHPVRGAADRDDLVDIVRDYLMMLGAGKELSGSLSMVVDELVTNAVYNAPRDAAGAPVYASTDRREKVQLDAFDDVLVRFGSDGGRFAVSVTDRFGALRPARIRAGLRRCLTQREQIERKAGGAGLGLYSVLMSCNQLVINVDPGARTEVIAVAEIGDRMRGLRARGHSLHLFFDGPAGADSDGVVSSAIELSDSMRNEMYQAVRASAPEREPAVFPLRKRKSSTPAPIAHDHRRGDLLVFDNELHGIDTMIGVLHGAARPGDAFEAALRFLLQCYEGAIAYGVEGNRLMPWFAAGRVPRWDALRDTSIPLHAECTIARFADRACATRFAFDDTALDRALSAAAAGTDNAAGVIVPAHVGGRLVGVAVAFGARWERQIALPVAEHLRTELELKLASFGASRSVSGQISAA